MLAEQSLKENDLAGSLAHLQAQIRKDPSNASHRVFLFQLLSVLGQWDRALTQLKVLADMDAETLPMVQTYREAIRCEMLRAEIFAGKRSPIIFGKPEQWLALMVEAMGVSDPARGADLRAEALEAAPTTSGTLNDRRFEWIADADGRLGPIVEAVVNGRYYWIPVHRLREIQIEEPADLRDMVWTPVQFTFANGGQTVGLIPTRYAGSEASEDPAIQLARKTEWIEAAPDCFVGQGQRLLTTDAEEVALLEARTIVLESEDDEFDAPSDEPPQLDADISLRHG